MERSVLERAPDKLSGEPETVLVAGAGGGIGNAFCEALVQVFPAIGIVRLARRPAALEPLRAPTTDLACDISDEESIAQAIDGLPEGMRIDWVFVATGWLHDEERSPEKTYRSLDPANLAYAYQINAIGPAILVKHLIPHLSRSRPARIGILSARVGSISDNRLGGWHAYRASKAALNMLIKNYAIELVRQKPGHVIVGLQPGTTDTGLSAPFQRNVPKDQLQTPEFTATRLLGVMRRLRQEDSGGLFDFEGLPFAP
jgi:NAD(P)-dependent dehydrogenase (short-subunit alcohol dehydrogenase family)